MSSHWPELISLAYMVVFVSGGNPVWEQKRGSEREREYSLKCLWVREYRLKMSCQCFYVVENIVLKKTTTTTKPCEQCMWSSISSLVWFRSEDGKRSGPRTKRISTFSLIFTSRICHPIVTLTTSQGQGPVSVHIRIGRSKLRAFR